MKHIFCILLIALFASSLSAQLQPAPIKLYNPADGSRTNIDPFAACNNQYWGKDSCGVIGFHNVSCAVPGVIWQQDPCDTTNLVPVSCLHVSVTTSASTFNIGGNIFSIDGTSFVDYGAATNNITVIGFDSLSPCQSPSLFTVDADFTGCAPDAGLIIEMPRDTGDMDTEAMLWERTNINGGSGVCGGSSDQLFRIRAYKVSSFASNTIYNYSQTKNFNGTGVGVITIDVPSSTGDHGFLKASFEDTNTPLTDRNFMHIKSPVEDSCGNKNTKQILNVSKLLLASCCVPAGQGALYSFALKTPTCFIDNSCDPVSVTDSGTIFHHDSQTGTITLNSVDANLAEGTGACLSLFTVFQADHSGGTLGGNWTSSGTFKAAGACCVATTYLDGTGMYSVPAGNGFSGDATEIVVTDACGALTTSPAANLDFDLTLPCGTGQIILTAGNGDILKLGASASIVTTTEQTYNSTAGSISLQVGDSAGVEKVLFKDSTGATVGSIDSNGNAVFNNLSNTNTGDEVAATETVAGIAEIATAAEITTGSDNTRIVSPLGLEGWNGGTGIITVGTIGTGTWEGTAIATSFIADNAITLDKLEHGTSGDVLYYGACGVPLRLAKGTDCQVLTLTSGLPVWEDAAGGAGSMAFMQIRRTTSKALTVCFETVTFDATDDESCTSVIQHNDCCTFKMDLKVNGSYYVQTGGHTNFTSACGASAQYGHRFLLCCVVQDGSNHPTSPIASICGFTFGGAIPSGFFVEVTCAPSVLTFEMDETSGNVNLSAGLTITIQQK